MKYKNGTLDTSHPSKVLLFKHSHIVDSEAWRIKPHRGEEFFFFFFPQSSLYLEHLRNGFFFLIPPPPTLHLIPERAKAQGEKTVHVSIRRLGLGKPNTKYVPRWLRKEA
jgi:hypothetical protein